MGQSKLWLPWRGQTLLEAVVSAVATVCQPVVVVASAEEPLPELPAAMGVVRDAVPFAGPLSGLVTGLSALEARMAIEAEATPVFVTGCDTPFLTSAVIQRFVDRLGSADAVVLLDADRRRPLPGVYRIKALPHAAALLASGQRRLLDLLDRLTVVELEPQALADVDPEGLCGCNLNTPAEYATALARAERLSTLPAASPAVPPPGTANR